MEFSVFGNKTQKNIKQHGFEKQGAHKKLCGSIKFKIGKDLLGIMNKRENKLGQNLVRNELD